jgi:uncharacterized protein (TIRG00374 family)
MYYLLERRGLPKARSALVGPLFYAVDYAVFILLLGIGFTALLQRGEGHAEAMAALPSLAALVVGGFIAWRLAARPRRLEAVLAGIARFLNGAARLARLSARVPPGFAREAAETVAEVRDRLRGHPGIGFRLFGAGLAMLLCDVATMAFAFGAFGVWVGVPTAFLGFCMASVGAVFSVLPGGLGTFDAAMVLGFTGLGVPRPAALAATVAYRVIATWLPALLGLFAWRAWDVGSGKREPGGRE